MRKVGKKIGLLAFVCLVITMLVFWMLPMGSLFADGHRHWNSHPNHSNHDNGDEDQDGEDDCEGGSVTIIKIGLELGDTAIFTLTGPHGYSQQITFTGIEGGGATESQSFDSLHHGDYALSESWGTNVYEYTTDLDTSTFSIGREGDGDMEITVTNTPIIEEIPEDVPVVPTSGVLHLIKQATGTTTGVGGAKYGVFNQGVLYQEITTQSDGTANVSLALDTDYTVQEITAPAGYGLDPVSYPIRLNSSQVDLTLTVFDPPIPTGGGETITVAAITEPVITVLAFTGIDPIIPITGGSVIVGGLGLFMASFLRKIRRNKK
jgi:hypothetical protein